MSRRQALEVGAHDQACGATNLGRRRRILSTTARCSSPTTPAPSSAATAFSAGLCPPAFSTCLREFRDRTNGRATPSGAGLLGALAYFGLDAIGATEKEDMRALVMRGGPWSDDERGRILDYCESDVEALARLLPAMLQRIDLPRALLRGRYMAAAAAMEHNGVPIDVETLGQLREHWAGIQDRLIADIDVGCGYHVYDGRTFKADRFEQYLIRSGIPWPRTETGRLSLSDDAFRQAAKSHPRCRPLRELRCALSDMRLNDLAVGRDGRNRTILSAFRAARAATNRATPSSFSGPPSGCAG